MQKNPGFRTLAGAALLLACALAAGCAGSKRPAPAGPPAVVPPEVEPPAPQEPSHEPVGVWHIVQRGETLWRIAHVYGTSVETIAAVNRVADPSRIDVDTPLWIPGATHAVEIEPPLRVAAGDWVWPVPAGRILSGFGAPRRNRKHAGLDISGAAGQPVLAARAGRVLYRGATMRGYGKTVIIDHGDGLQSLYAHNSSLLVQVGDQVRTGDTIARVGRTGNATTEHCHFEIRRRNVPVDPLGFFPPEARR